MMKLVKKTGKNRSGGFTLVELIVVLVILGILAAIMVPALLGWIDKAKNQDAILECRNVVQAAQAQVAEEYGKKSVSKAEMENVINGDGAVEAIIKTADVDGDIRDRSIRLNDQMVLTDLVYTTEKGIRVIYDRNYSPVYRIDGEGKYTSDVPGYNAQVSDLGAKEWDVSRFLDEKGNLKDEYKDKGYGNAWQLKENDSRRLQAAYLEKYGSFPAVDWGQVHLPDGVKFTGSEAVWKPIMTKEGTIIMVADTLNSVGNAMAAVVYCNGEYYYHNHTAGNPSVVSSVSVHDINFSIDNLKDKNNWTPFDN